MLNELGVVILKDDFSDAEYAVSIDKINYIAKSNDVYYVSAEAFEAKALDIYTGGASSRIRLSYSSLERRDEVFDKIVAEMRYPFVGRKEICPGT
ncbi:MAG TPA: hypothetical protein P5539_14290 [Mesotoga sp.]|nr:hypothetical protein [Mesotoga sp.]